MSDKIDQRVVQMQFDNRQFEEGTRSTVKSIDTLKKSLDFEGSSKGLDRLIQSVDNISSKFSTMSIAGITAIQNLTNSAVNYAKNLVDQFTVTPVYDGYADYVRKLTSVQTIMNATGESIDVVNGYFKELDTYADKTVYNLDDMTSSFAKFTNAGVKMETSVPAIKGIANMVALAGQNANAASIAMYNLSQSIAGGFLTTTDYRSLNLANVATQEWKDNMIKAAEAAGSITKQANGMYAVLGSKNTYSAAQLFNDALSDQWATADILLKVLGDYGDETTAIGKKALAAAQDVKDFGMMMETLKAAAGTGWTDSLSLLLGDLEESKKLFTPLTNTLGGFLEALSKTRNDMLQFWHDNGGREAIINAIVNSFRELEAILGPIRDGFNEVFPPMTGKRLVEISKQIEDFTEKFKLSDETIEKIKATFKGMFAIVSIGNQIFTAFVNNLLSMLGVTTPLADGLLTITSYIGYFFIGLNKTLKGSDAINTTMSKSFGVFAIVAGAIGKVASSLFELINEFVKMAFGIDLGPIFGFTKDTAEEFDNVATKVDSTVTSLKDFKTTVSDAVNVNVKKPLQDLWDKFNGGDEAMTKFKEKLQSLFTLDNLGKFLDALATGVFISFLLKLRKIASNGAEISKSLVGVFDEIKNSLKAYQTELKASALEKIAISIGILVASLVVLSFISSDDLAKAIGVITVLFLELFGSLAAFNKIVDDKNSVSVMKLAASLMFMSTSLFIMSGILIRVSKIPFKEMATGLLGMVSMTGILLIASEQLSKQEGSMIKSSLGLNAFAAAMYILAGVIEDVGKMKPEELGQGLVGLLMMIGTLAIILNSKEVKNIGIGTGLGMIGIAASMMVLAEALELLGRIEVPVLQQGLVVLGGLLISMATFMALLGNVTNLMSIGGALLLISGSMLVLSEAISLIGRQPIMQVAIGLGSIVIALLGVAGAMRLMPKDMLSNAGALAVVSLALIGIASSIAIVAQLPTEGVQNAFIGLAGSLIVIAAAVNVMNGALPGAAAMLVMAAALAIFIPEFMLLGLMPIDNIKIALIALAGSFAVLGLAAGLLWPLIPAMAAMSAAVMLMGIALLAAGAGVATFAIGLATLAGLGYVAGPVLAELFTSLANVIPIFGQKLAEGIGMFSKTLVENMPAIQRAFGALIASLITVITLYIPQIVTAFIVMINAILTKLSEYLPQYIEAGWKMIEAFARGIGDHIQDMIEIGIQIMVGFMNGLASKVPDLIDAGFKMIIAFILGLATAIEVNTPLLIVAMNKLLDALSKAAVLVMASLGDRLWDAGTNAIKLLHDAIANKLEDVKDTIKAMPKEAIASIKASSGDFYTAGFNVIQGMINGAKGAIKGVWDAGKEIGSAMFTATCNVLDINSPSKIFEWIGKMVDVGMADGVDKNAGRPLTSMDAMTQSLIDTAKSKLGVDAGANVGTDFTSGLASSITSGGSAVTAAVKSAFDLAVEEIDERKYYNTLNLQDELILWQRLQAAYKIGSEERKKADREVYRVKMALIQQSADAEKASYDFSSSWIEEQKYYNKLSLKEELAAWQRVQSRYKVDTELRKKADREVYRVKQEMAAKQKAIDEDYYNSTKAINEQLESDIKDLNDAYESAIKSRAETIYDTYGLFDEVAAVEDMDGSVLIENLRDQVNAIEEFQEIITNLNTRHVDPELISELSDMGPSALTQLEAINKMTDSELETYVHLWKQKHANATTEATYELQGLQTETASQIEELQKQAKTDLEEYKNIWIQSTADLSTGVIENINETSREVVEAVAEIKMETSETFVETVGIIQDTISNVDWTSLGASIVSGITNGIRGNIASLVSASWAMGATALQAAKKSIDSNSPSKKFMDLGEDANAGFIIGLKSMGSEVSDAGANMGDTAINVIQSAINKIFSILNGDIDLTPTIRPVIDTTDITAGLASVFGSSQTLDVSSAAIKAASIGTLYNGQNGGVSTTNTSNVVNDITINNSYTVRSDSDIRKISRELNNTLVKYNNAKGVTV